MNEISHVTCIPKYCSPFYLRNFTKTLKKTKKVMYAETQAEGDEI